MTDLRKPTTTCKHLTFEDRIEIQDCLFHGVSFKGIARRIGKDPTTVSKEVKKHIQVIPARTENPRPCPDLMKAPFVCNGCQRKRYCKLEKHEYLAKFAHQAYRETLVESRSGIALSKESFYENDRIISEGINKGQHLYHIIQSQNLSVSKSTFYRHLHKGYLFVAPLDMPRVVKFKPRRAHSKDYIPPKLKQGRTFDCFEEFISQNDISNGLRWTWLSGALAVRSF